VFSTRLAFRRLTHTCNNNMPIKFQYNLIMTFKDIEYIHMYITIFFGQIRGLFWPMISWLCKTELAESLLDFMQLGLNLLSLESWHVYCISYQVSVVANVAFQNKERIPYLPIKTCLPLEEHARNILSPYA
jgi:hypothetical protein